MQFSRPSKLSVSLLGVFLLVMFLQVKPLAAADQREIAPQTGKQQLLSHTATPLAAPSLRVKQAQSVALQVEPTTTPLPTEIPLPTATPLSATSEDYPADFPGFVYQVANGDQGVRGIYVDGLFSFRVIQQPANDASFVSTDAEVVTQFRSAEENGVVGLLAHNFLAGAHFYNLTVGQTVRVVYGNATYRRYRLASIQSFQKLTVSSLQSDMIELSTGKRLTTDEVFTRFYTGGEHITFQTCLERAGEPSWGLTFFVAEPY